MESTLIAYDGKLDYEQLALVPTPAGTATHKTIPHHEVVNALVETLGFRQLGIHAQEYCVSKDGNKMFGLLELDAEINGIRFAIGLRNSHDKSMRLAMTVGYRVFVCQNMAFQGDYEPMLHKHSRHFNLMDSLAIGVDRMQRNFAPMVQAVDRWRQTQLTDVSVKMLIYSAFIEGNLEVARHLARDVHQNYFEPQLDDFKPRTLWSLSNSFTSAFKSLDPIPQHKATASLAGFLEKL